MNVTACPSFQFIITPATRTSDTVWFVVDCLNNLYGVNFVSLQWHLPQRHFWSKRSVHLDHTMPTRHYASRSGNEQQQSCLPDVSGRHKRYLWKCQRSLLPVPCRGLHASNVRWSVQPVCVQCWHCRFGRQSSNAVPALRWRHRLSRPTRADFLQQCDRLWSWLPRAPSTNCLLRPRLLNMHTWTDIQNWRIQHIIDVPTCDSLPDRRGAKHRSDSNKVQHSKLKLDFIS